MKGYSCKLKIFLIHELGHFMLSICMVDLSGSIIGRTLSPTEPAVFCSRKKKSAGHNF